jgi:hypothetical protein
MKHYVQGHHHHRTSTDGSTTLDPETGSSENSSLSIV